MALSPSPLPVFTTTCNSALSAAGQPRNNMAKAMPPVAALAEQHNKPSASSSSDSPGVPKMEPFNRSRISRLIREPSLLEKAEHALSDRCTILEGDDAYRCWEALFGFENLKEEYTVQCDVAASSERSSACRPLERLENVVRQSGGAASLINNVRMLAKANEMRKSAQAKEEASATVSDNVYKHGGHDGDGDGDGDVHFFPEPGSLPPSQEELELLRSAKMPESPFTRVLRKMGNPSSWFSQAPGFETV